MAASGVLSNRPLHSSARSAQRWGGRVALRIIPIIFILLPAVVSGCGSSSSTAKHYYSYAPTAACLKQALVEIHRDNNPFLALPTVAAVATFSSGSQLRLGFAPNANDAAKSRALLRFLAMSYGATTDLTRRESNVVAYGVDNALDADAWQGVRNCLR